MTWEALGLALPGWVPSPLEWAGFLTGAACVWLVVRQNVWNFPVGIASCVALFVFFADGKLYANAGLQVVFVALSAHGWYHWLRGGPDKSALTVSRVPRREAALLGAFAVVVTPALHWLLRAYNDPAPWLDAVTTALSLVAQWLLNRKFVETWPVWIVVDALTVGLAASQGFVLTAVLYAVYLGMCVVGWREWRRAMRK